MERWRRGPFRGGLAAVVAGGLGAVVLAAVPGGAAVAGERATPECTNKNLTASYRGGDAAMSHVYGRIVLRNTSDETCWVRGYGGLSYVGGGNGTQVGAPADRTPSNRPKVVLAPGEKVRSAVVETSYAPYPRARCRPRHVDGFRVYLPDETRSQFIEHEATGCANPDVHLLAHKAYH